MTPSSREHLRDQQRRISEAERRDPITNAVSAFMSLSPEDRMVMCRRVNKLLADEHHPLGELIYRPVDEAGRTA